MSGAPGASQMIGAPGASQMSGAPGARLDAPGVLRQNG